MEEVELGEASHVPFEGFPETPRETGKLMENLLFFFLLLVDEDVDAVVEFHALHGLDKGGLEGMGIVVHDTRDGLVEVRPSGRTYLLFLRDM
jgi:hypothetical protein